MSDYQNGYDQGYEDGLNGYDSRLSGHGLIDAILPVTDREEEWREGYEEDYKDGQEERIRRGE